jgi:quinol monooxygenase YgiN
MQSLLRTSFVLAILSFGLLPAAHADVKLSNGTMLPDKPYFIVTYIEADPVTAATVAGLLKEQTAASRKDPGNLRAETLQRIGQPNHFVLLEAWADGDARQAHAKAAHTVKFRDALQPYLYNPYDERPHVGLVAVDPGKIAKGTGDTVYVVTHADIIPPEQFAPCKRQVKETGPCGNDLVIGLVNASRKHSGNVRFDALTQANRPNHMTIVEMWDTAQHQQAHQVTVDVKNFRDSLSGIIPGSGVADDPLFVLNPLTGSLYDERLYKTID